MFRLLEELEHVLTNSHWAKKTSQDEEPASPGICHYNMRLKICNLVDKTADEDYYNPIDLSYIFKENDPINTWIREAEEPVLDEHDINWLERELDE